EQRKRNLLPQRYCAFAASLDHELQVAPTSFRSLDQRQGPAGCPPCSPCSWQGSGPLFHSRELAVEIKRQWRNDLSYSCSLAAAEADNAPSKWALFRNIPLFSVGSR